MTRLQEAIGLGLVLGVIHGLLQPAYSVPVVPNFTQGSMTSHTETTSKVTETINSMDYNTGYQYSVSGSGVEPIGGNISPTTGQSNVTINGVNSTWTGATSTRPISNRQHQAQHFSSQKLTQGNWTEQPYNYSKRNDSYKRNRYYKYLPAVILSAASILSPAQVLSETIGGVSATAAPVANSSGR